MTETSHDDLDRLRRLAFVVSSSERKLGLRVQSERSLIARLDDVLGSAIESGALHPAAYSVCYRLRKSFDAGAARD